MEVELNSTTKHLPLYRLPTDILAFTDGAEEEGGNTRPAEWKVAK